MMSLWSEFVHQPLFGASLTLVFYAAALSLHRRWKALHPLFLTSGGIIALLIAARIPYEAYKAGGDMISFLLGPATVSLGVPLYKQAQKIKSRMVAICSGITAGALSGMISAAAIAWAMGAPKAIILTMLPKSVTTPISIEIVKHLGGIPEIGAIVTTVTGLLGSMIGPEFLRLCGVRSDIPIGAAIGTASHGIGTARVIRESELQGSVSGFAMGVAGILTSFLMIPVYGYLS